MSTYTNSPAVNTFISATSGTANVTLYTVPANSYAVINVYSATNDSGIRTGASNLLWTHVTGLEKSAQGIYVGPGQAISTTAAAGTVYIEGVLFTNQA